MRKILSEEQLAPGTAVIVGNREGTVKSVSLERGAGCSGGFVALHKIKFTHRRVRGFGNNYSSVKLPRPRTQFVNYSFIYAL